MCGFSEQAVLDGELLQVEAVERADVGPFVHDILSEGAELFALRVQATQFGYGLVDATIAPTFRQFVCQPQGFGLCAHAPSTAFRTLRMSL